MTLLRLSPDSERLRRIAKAHAAGELSTPDYRRIRAEVIESFAGAAPEATGRRYRTALAVSSDRACDQDRSAVVAA